MKILQESYLGKVKMIYIDPPYNTGNDFIYKDDFSVSDKDYKESVGAVDDDGYKIFKNTDSNGRFHSDWLSMMYERLVIARDLLKGDGIIFISIDDNEVSNLRKLCDEIFGEDLLVGVFSWKNKYGAGAKTKGLIEVHEYILCYSKTNLLDIESELSKEHMDEYDKKRDEKYLVRGGYITQPLMTTSLDDRENLRYSITYNGDVIKPRKQWVWEQKRLLKAIDDNEIVFKKKSNGEYSIRAKVYLKNDYGIIRKGKPISSLNGPFNQEGTREVAELLGNDIFSFPKPKQLIQYFLSVIINNIEERNGIYLDFFAGSATTAHAVMQLNAEDGGNRKFIMVQLPEPCNENSEAAKFLDSIGKPKNIAEIGKERIRRAGQKILKELEKKDDQLDLGQEKIDPSKLDIGFRVYKVDSTNMKDIFYHPSKLKQDELDLVISNIKEDRYPEDLLTQVILDLGLELSLPIETRKILNNTVFIVQTNSLAACFDNNIDFQIVDTIAELKPLKVVFKDNSFKDDKDRINVEERFKRLSPETIVTVI